MHAMKVTSYTSHHLSSYLCVLTYCVRRAIPIAKYEAIVIFALRLLVHCNYSVVSRKVCNISGSADMLYNITLSYLNSKWEKSEKNFWSFYSDTVITFYKCTTNKRAWTSVSLQLHVTGEPHTNPEVLMKMVECGAYALLLASIRQKIAVGIWRKAFYAF